MGWGEGGGIYLPIFSLLLFTQSGTLQSQIYQHPGDFHAVCFHEERLIFSTEQCVADVSPVKGVSEAISVRRQLQLCPPASQELPCGTAQGAGKRPRCPGASSFAEPPSAGPAQRAASS